MNLTPYGQVKPQLWMTADVVSKVLASLEAGENNAPVALFVGGCVRNAVLGKGIADIDIATILTPDMVMEKLKSSGIKALPTGIDHGTVTAVIGKESFEITTLRRDVSTDGRRAVVAFTEDWGEDARRRDFTMNTLLMDQGGNIYDPMGQGLDDLKAGRVRFVGDARQRVQEDYLRILRFFRFYGAYGKGAPDEDALAACREFAGDIVKLSKERITQEFRRILMADDPVPVLELMRKNKVLEELAASDAALSLLDKELSYPSRLLVLTGLREEGIDGIEQFLVVSKRDKAEIYKTLIACSLLDDFTEKSLKLCLYRYGREITRQAVLLKKESVTPEMGEILKHWEIPVLPLSGDDVKKAGVTQGPEIGLILSEIKQWWIACDFKPCRDECLARLKAILPPAAETSG